MNKTYYCRNCKATAPKYEEDFGLEVVEIKGETHYVNRCGLCSRL